jgi:hypothetical protein
MSARWRGHEHHELYSMINTGPGAGASDQQNQYWADLTTELKAVDDELNKALADMKASWSGAASDSASTASTPLQTWASDAQTGSSVMHTSTVDQAEFVSTARHEMPPPVEVTTPKPSAWQELTAGAAMLTGNSGPAAQVVQQSADLERQEAAKEAAAQKAVDTMTTYESNSTWNRNTLGTFVAPPDVVVETTQPSGGTGVGGPIGSGAGFAPPAGTREGSAQDAVRTPPGSGGGGGGGGGFTPPTGGGGNVPGVGGGGGGSHGLPGNGTTDPNFHLPGGPVPPGQYPAPTPAPAPPSHGPGVHPGPYPVPTGGGGFPGDPYGGSSNLSNRPGGGGPGLRGGPGGGGFNGPDGRGGLGGPGGGLEADGGRSGAAQLGRGGAAGVGMPGEGMVGRGGAGAGARGGAGMGGGPMGGGAQGDEDDEHRTPGYLLETTDVFGDARMVSPAVIGDDSNFDDEEK